jgi:hypothetical protein
MFALKRKLSILPVAFAALLLVAFTAVPHHHHGAMLCLATAQHEEAHNHDLDDACTAHHCAGENHANAGNHCAAEQEYLVSAQQEINCKHFSCTLHHPHPPFPLLPALFVPVNVPDNPAATPGGTHPYRPAVLLPESSGASQTHGLRAPPMSV